MMMMMTSDAVKAALQTPFNALLQVLNSGGAGSTRHDGMA
jgi:hypothetical protein